MYLNEHGLLQVRKPTDIQVQTRTPLSFSSKTTKPAHSTNTHL